MSTEYTESVTTAADPYPAEGSVAESDVVIDTGTADLREVPDLTAADHRSMFIRSCSLLGSYNFERMQAMGWAVSIMPAIKRFYPEKDEQIAALKRHLEFFNTQPWMSSVILGVTTAMERKRAAGAKEVDDASISAVKIGLMGPLAGVGDPIFWGTARPVLAALGASFALSGNIIGPLIFFFGMSIIRLLTRWFGQKFGYDRGTDLVADMGGVALQKVTTMASVLGLFVMGALVSKWTSMNFPTVISQYTDQTGAEQIVTVQSVLDSLLPAMVPLLLTFLCMWLLRRRVNAIWIILGMFVLGIVGYWLGILAP